MSLSQHEPWRGGPSVRGKEMTIGARKLSALASWRRVDVMFQSVKRRSGGVVTIAGRGRECVTLSD